MGKLTAVAVKAALTNPGTYQGGDGLFSKLGKAARLYGCSEFSKKAGHFGKSRRKSE
ncbi:hypothetical protein LCM19_02160 [Qipengyuania flava]|nr:hypothetical protein [Qipengyuania flava]